MFKRQSAIGDLQMAVFVGKIHYSSEPAPGCLPSPIHKMWWEVPSLISLPWCTVRLLPGLERCSSAPRAPLPNPTARLVIGLRALVDHHHLSRVNCPIPAKLTTWPIIGLLYLKHTLSRNIEKQLKKRFPTVSQGNLKYSWLAPPKPVTN